mgnify:CR=1 FL=1|tara:strand:+ start:341 stop:1162 length:822 start_codon:yes stop_codon:yes gene_type:complete
MSTNFDFKIKDQDDAKEKANECMTRHYAQRSSNRARHLPLHAPRNDADYSLDVSFLIGSATRDRPPEQFVNKAIANINEISKDSKYSYEILVISEEEITGDNVTWIKEEEYNDGLVGAYNALVPHTNGKYLVYTVDDCWFDDQFYTTIDLLESYVYNHRHLKLLCVGSDNGLGSFMPSSYPKYGVYRYPVVAKETVMNFFDGHLFHPDFKNHYADNWLGYWVAHMFDETMVEVWNTTVHIPDGAPSYNHHNDADKSAFDALVKRFQEGYHRYI